MTILEYYPKAENPGAFSGLSGLKNIKYKNKNIKKTLTSTSVYTLHKPKRLNVKLLKVEVLIDKVYLIDMKALKGSNNGFTFIFTCIDVFS
jgi:hypothetical protein